MKLKYSALIERMVRVTLILMGLPFILTVQLLHWMVIPFEWISDKVIEFADYVGNRLLRASEEVRDGYIKNDYFIRCYTAIMMQRFLKESGKEANYDDRGLEI